MESESRKFYQLLTNVNDKRAPRRIVLMAEPFAYAQYLTMCIEEKQWREGGGWKWTEVEGSHRQVEVEGLDSSIVKAIAKEELVGDSAKEIMHALFWQCVVNDDDGIRYLGEHVPEAERFYLGCRIDALAAQSEAVKAVLDATLNADVKLPNRQYRKTKWRLLSICQRVLADADLSDAIESIVSMAGKSEDHSRERHILHLVGILFDGALVDQA